MASQHDGAVVDVWQTGVTRGGHKNGLPWQRGRDGGTVSLHKLACEPRNWKTLGKDINILDSSLA